MLGRLWGPEATWTGRRREGPARVPAQPSLPGTALARGQPPGLCGRADTRGRAAHEGQTESPRRRGQDWRPRPGEVTLCPRPRAALALSPAPGPRGAASARRWGARGRAAPRGGAPGPAGRARRGHPGPEEGGAAAAPGRCLDSCGAAGSPAGRAGPRPTSGHRGRQLTRPPPGGPSPAPPPSPARPRPRPLAAAQTLPLCLRLWLRASLGGSPRARGGRGRGRGQRGRGDAFHPRRAGGPWPGVRGGLGGGQLPRQKCPDSGGWGAWRKLCRGPRAGAGHRAGARCGGRQGGLP